MSACMCLHECGKYIGLGLCVKSSECVCMDKCVCLYVNVFMRV